MDLLLGLWFSCTFFLLLVFICYLGLSRIYPWSLSSCLLRLRVSIWLINFFLFWDILWLFSAMLQEEHSSCVFTHPSKTKMNLGMILWLLFFYHVWSVIVPVVPYDICRSCLAFTIGAMYLEYVDKVLNCVVALWLSSLAGMHWWSHSCSVLGSSLICDLAVPFSVYLSQVFFSVIYRLYPVGHFSPSLMMFLSFMSCIFCFALCGFMIGLLFRI